MKLYLHPSIRPYFSGRATQFDQCMGLDGAIYRDQEGRKTQRVMIGDKYYFIKKHFGIGWKEIFKNWSQLREPVLGARNEWEALQRLDAYGVRVPKCIGYGESSSSPAKRQSFVIMEEVSGGESLETICEHWRDNPPTVTEKWTLINEVATIARKLHSHQINHRDFYLCHFLRKHIPESDKPVLYLIDLHRAKQWKKLPKRWIIKDLSGLYFSAKDVPLTKRDLFRFMKAYCQKDLRTIWQTEKPFWQHVKQRGEALYRDLNSK